MVGSPDPPACTRNQPQQVAAGRRHSTIIDLRSTPRIPSSDLMPGVDSSNHSRERDQNRPHRSLSDKDQLPAQYSQFNDSGLIDSHGSSSLGSSGNLKANRASTGKQIKKNRSRDLESLARLGLELQEENDNAIGEDGSRQSGSDVAKAEPSRSKKAAQSGNGEGLSTNSGRNLEIDLDSVEAKAIIKLQKQLKNAQAEILHAHKKSTELSLDNAQRGVQIHELTQQVKDLLALKDQHKALLAENEALQRMVKRGAGDSLRQDNDMLRREIDKLRKDNQRMAEQKGNLKTEVSYLRKEREGALLEIDRLRMDAQRMADQKNEAKKELAYLRKDREAMKDKLGRMKTENGRRAQEDLMMAKTAAAFSASAKHHRSGGGRASIRVAGPPLPSAPDGVVKASVAPGLNDDLLRRNGRRPMS
jgi:chromosome segregation ATPase